MIGKIDNTVLGLHSPDILMRMPISQYATDEKQGEDSTPSPETDSGALP